VDIIQQDIGYCSEVGTVYFISHKKNKPPQVALKNKGIGNLPGLSTPQRATENTLS
jgi:hypothetical protein